MIHKHLWIPSEHENYDRCLECGGYHNRIPFPRENYLDNYWDESKGHSTLEAQRWNCENFVNERDESKVQAVLKYCVGNVLLEIGCAPGSFLYAARTSGKFPRFECDLEGVEPDERYVREISEYSDASIIWTGFFEDIDFGSRKYSTIVAMDILEHMDDPEKFIEKAMGLLEDGGRLILMLPLADSCREQDFHPEHQNLFSRKFIEEWLAPTVIEEWWPGHTILVVEKA